MDQSIGYCVRFPISSTLSQQLSPLLAALSTCSPINRKVLVRRTCQSPRLEGIVSWAVSVSGDRGVLLVSARSQPFSGLHRGPRNVAGRI
jgi:hypothetical protein